MLETKSRYDAHLTSTPLFSEYHQKYQALVGLQSEVCVFALWIVNYTEYADIYASPFRNYPHSIKNRQDQMFLLYRKEVEIGLIIILMNISGLLFESSKCSQLSDKLQDIIFTQISMFDDTIYFLFLYYQILYENYTSHYFKEEQICYHYQNV